MLWPYTAVYGCGRIHPKHKISVYKKWTIWYLDETYLDHMKGTRGVPLHGKFHENNSFFIWILPLNTLKEFSFRHFSRKTISQFFTFTIWLWLLYIHTRSTLSKIVRMSNLNKFQLKNKQSIMVYMYWGGYMKCSL